MTDSKNNTSSRLSPEKIERIAFLARLSVTPEESRQYSEQLSKVLDYFEQISAIPTEGVEPLVTPTEVQMVWRPDEVKTDCSVKEILANAPESTGSLFTVPPVV